MKWKSKTEMMKRTLGSPSYFFIRRRLLRQLGWLCEVRNPKQKFVHHSAQTNEDSDVQDGDDHQGDLAILEPVIPATPLLKPVGSNGVDELLAVPLLLDEPGWEEIGEKEEKNDSTYHIEDWIHDACSRLLYGCVSTEMKSGRGEIGLLPWETRLVIFVMKNCLWTVITCCFPDDELFMNQDNLLFSGRWPLHLGCAAIQTQIRGMDQAFQLPPSLTGRLLMKSLQAAGFLI